MGKSLPSFNFKRLRKLTLVFRDQPQLTAPQNGWFVDCITKYATLVTLIVYASTLEPTDAFMEVVRRQGNSLKRLYTPVFCPSLDSLRNLQLAGIDHLVIGGEWGLEVSV